MVKKHKKILIFCFFFLLCTVFLYLSSDYVRASLEARYPVLKTPEGEISIDETIKLPEYVKYLFYFGMAFGFFSVFISMAIAGAMYFFSPINVEIKASAKDRFYGAISGLLILSLTWLILITINPQLVQLNLDEVKTVEIEKDERTELGVYFYSEQGCEDDKTSAKITDIPDLGNLRNNIFSVGFVRDSNTAYIAVLYDEINFEGKCFYLNPNEECQSVQPFAASASVHQYAFRPGGNGVYIYRKSYFNKEGGFLHIPSSSLSGIYEASLDDLSFEDPSCTPDGCCVPKEERDCIKYNKDGSCEQRVCPKLSGENISSIKTNGYYFVMLVYAGPGQNCHTAEVDFCQGFPSPDDVNKIGPQQIKWDKIKNNNLGVIPNCIVIIPIIKE